LANDDLFDQFISPKKAERIFTAFQSWQVCEGQMDARKRFIAANPIHERLPDIRNGARCNTLFIGNAQQRQKAEVREIRRAMFALLLNLQDERVGPEQHPLIANL
jgi:hypothetical protein